MGACSGGTAERLSSSGRRGDPVGQEGARREEEGDGRAGLPGSQCASVAVPWPLTSSWDSPPPLPSSLGSSFHHPPSVTVGPQDSQQAPVDGQLKSLLLRELSL